MPDASSPKRPVDGFRLDGARTLFLTQFYRPELIGSGPFCADLAEWMAGQGSHVTVVAGPPHYPQADDFRSIREDMPSREVVNGVLVERIKSYVPATRNAARRILAELSFAGQAVWGLLTRRIARAPFVLTLCPSIMTCAVGVLARTRGGRHVAIVHDIQSGLAKNLGIVKSPWFHRALQACERFVLNRADLVVVLTETMKEELRRIGIATPIEVAPIWVDADTIVPIASSIERAPRLLYSGNLGRKQGLDQVIRLAQTLAKARPEIEVVFRGEGSERGTLQQQVSELGLANVHFDTLRPADRLAEGLADGDVHLVPQEPAAAEFAVPSKVYAIMSAGRTFVATANRGSPLWRLRRESGGFLTVPANDDRQFAAGVLRLLDNAALRNRLGARGRRYIEKQCSRERVMAQLCDIFWKSLEPERGAQLIVEADAMGHQAEWLMHLIEHAMRNRSDRLTWFAVAPELFDAATGAARKSNGKVRTLALTPLEAVLCHSRSLALSGIARWWVARRYVALTGVEQVHMQELDHLALPLALGLGARAKITGTLFRPSVHYSLIGTYEPTRSERLRDLRKSVLYRLMLANPILETVYSLDPFFVEYARQSYGHGAKVEPLGDPAHPVAKVLTKERALAGRIPDGRVSFLMFGYLTARKGTLVLLDALRALPSTHDRHIAVMLSGRVEPAIRARVEGGLVSLQTERPDLWIGFEDRRTTPGELEALVQRCDVLLAPYQRFVGSSGVLMWAARAGKPVLTQDFGVMGALVRELGLGRTVDTTDPRALAEGLVAMSGGVNERFDRNAALTFSAEHTPLAFAATILRTS
jgi:colanic acid biosynthesis glycosyl transferase WcaI